MKSDFLNYELNNIKMSECNICIEISKNIIECNFCNFKSCENCCKKYMLSQNQYAHCMNCKKEWVRKVLIEKFGIKFVNNEYKKHREEYLFDLEKAQLPAAQLELEQINACEALKKSIQTRIKEIDAEIHELNSLKWTEKFNLNNVINGLHGIEKPVIKFIKKCPGNNCNGYLSEKWKCGLCDTNVCSKCHEIKNEEHKCIEEIVQSIKLLKQDSKPCPNCAAMIYRIDGCDQMFCVECHIAFSWKTGRQEHNKIHNPHYFEWMRNNKTEIEIKDPGENKCDRTLNLLPRKIIDLDCKFDTEVIRKIIHIERVSQQFARDRNGKESRFRYLQNDISLEIFKRQIQQNNKANEKNHEKHEILTMFIQVSSELMFKFVDDCEFLSENQRTINSKNLMKELHNLKEYTNNCLEDVSKVYNCACEFIDNKFEITRNGKPLKY